MTLIRFGQPRLVAIFPHNANSKYIVTVNKPSQAKDIITDPLNDAQHHTHGHHHHTVLPGDSI